ncbi:hypothetical protein J6590_083338 [Homalodisca vitripennis]|nr:hypothetical protein J6590_083338 [Homalodisca vitripennis]
MSLSFINVSLLTHLSSDASIERQAGYNRYRRIKQRRAWLRFRWMTAERSCPCKQPSCPAIGGGSEVTFKPLVPKLSVREGVLALASPGLQFDSNYLRSLGSNIKTTRARSWGSRVMSSQSTEVITSRGRLSKTTEWSIIKSSSEVDVTDHQTGRGRRESTFVIKYIIEKGHE